MRRQRAGAFARWARDERGQSAIEFVLVLPFILMLVFLFAEATSLLRTWMVLENASREGARQAAVRKTASEVIDITVQRTDGMISPANVRVTNARGTPGTDTQVEITYTYEFKSPLARFVRHVTRGDIETSATLYAHTHMRLE